MSSLPRKAMGSSSSVLTAIPPLMRAAVKQPQVGALPSSAYLDAVNILSEATMLEACSLALYDKDYEKGRDADDAKSDLRKLLDLEKKCRQAAKVVKKEAIPAPSMMPPTMPTMPAARVNVAAVKKATTGMSSVMGNAPKALVGKTAVAGQGISAVRRGSTGGSRPNMPVKRTMVQPKGAQRAESDDSSLGSDHHANKKARIGNEGGDAPPPSALTFLKKLNQERETTTTTSSQEKNNKTEQNNDEERNAHETSECGKPGPPLPLPQRGGTRKNPVRTSRR